MRKNRIKTAENSRRASGALRSRASLSDASAPVECDAYRGAANCKIASAMVRIGATDAEMSEALGIGVPTFYAWKTTHGDFADVLKWRPIVFDEARPEANNAAVDRAAIKLALGSNETTEKVVRTPLGEVIRAHSVYKPPSVRAAQCMLSKRMPDLYGKRRVSSFPKAPTLFNRSAANEKCAIRCPEETCRVVRTIARLCAADFEMAAALGISLADFNEMRRTHAGFSEAIEAGEAMLNAALEKALLQRAQGFSYLAEKFVCTRDGRIVLQRKLKHIRPDTKAWDIWLRAHPIT